MRAGVHRPAPQGVVAQLGGAVHEILQIGSGERERVAGGQELGGRLPAAVGRRLEGDADGAVLQSAGPHERGRDVQMRMGGVDPGVGAVSMVAVKGVVHLDGAVLAPDGPAIRVGSAERKRMPLPIGGAHGVDVLGELVERVAAWRGAAHPKLDRLAHGEAGEPHRDFCLVVHRVGEADVVDDSLGIQTGRK